MWVGPSVPAVGGGDNGGGSEFLGGHRGGCDILDRWVEVVAPGVGGGGEPQAGLAPPFAPA